jgi:hypothetical protein
MRTRFVPTPSTDGSADIILRAPSRRALDELRKFAETGAARRGCTITWAPFKKHWDDDFEVRGVTTPRRTS